MTYSLTRKIIGTRIDATSYTEVCDRIENWIAHGVSAYVVVANVHVVMTAHWQPAYQAVLAQADLVTPDGMPLVWAMRLLGIRGQPRVYGPDLMLAWCDRANRQGFSIYLYGSSTENLEQLATKLKVAFPDLAIAGTYAPPQFAATNFQELEADINRINQTGAQVILVALGCPKQEYWMAQAKGKLHGVAIGVGAAFDFHSGRVAQAPRWVMNLGLEWLFRLIQEPGRLWQRYLINNPMFVWLFAVQWVKYKLYCLY